MAENQHRNNTTRRNHIAPNDIKIDNWN